MILRKHQRDILNLLRKINRMNKINKVFNGS